MFGTALEHCAVDALHFFIGRHLVALDRVTPQKHAVEFTPAPGVVFWHSSFFAHLLAAVLAAELSSQ
jgi:hypothetical protein